MSIKLAEPWEFPHAFWFGWSVCVAVLCLLVTVGFTIGVVLTAVWWLAFLPAGMLWLTVDAVKLSVAERRARARWRAADARHQDSANRAQTPAGPPG